MRVALDLDGTLIDAQRRQVAVAQSALDRAAGTALDAHRFWARKRAGRTTLEALLDLGVPDRVAADAAGLWSADIESQDQLRLDAPLPGTREALAIMRSREWDLFVLTARRDVRAVLAQVDALDLDLDPASTFVVDPRDAATQKARVLRDQQADAFIGDTESDARAAGLAGVRFLAVSTGQRSAEWLRANDVPEVHPDIVSAVLALG
jgi:phosphoglycolate phosphatase-like HAD superfamily hydrolase